MDIAATTAVVVLFFLHGAKLSREALTSAFRHWRLHLTILSITFVLFPILGLVASLTMPRLLSADLWSGVLFLCALPSTVQSSIAFTSIARGNVGGTVASAVDVERFLGPEERVGLGLWSEKFFSNKAAQLSG